MPESSSDRANIGIVLVLGWLAFALLYPLSWTPSTVVVRPGAKGQRTIPLKLPDASPLRLMLERGSRVSLTLPVPQPPTDPSAAAKAQLTAAAPTAVMPASTETVGQVIVQSTVCLGDDRKSNCYAVLSMPVEHVERVMRATQVWVILEQQ
jgi:hypothetical protein